MSVADRCAQQGFGWLATVRFVLVRGATHLLLLQTRGWLVIAKDEFTGEQVADDVLIADRRCHAEALVRCDSEESHDTLNFRIDDANDVAAGKIEDDEFVRDGEKMLTRRDYFEAVDSELMRFQRINQRTTG